MNVCLLLEVCGLFPFLTKQTTPTIRAVTSITSKMATPTPTPMPMPTKLLLTGTGSVWLVLSVWSSGVAGSVWSSGVAITNGGGMVLSNCSTTVKVYDGVGFGTVIPRVMVLVVEVAMGISKSFRSFRLTGNCWAQRKGRGGCRVGGSWGRHTSWRVVAFTRNALLSNI